MVAISTKSILAPNSIVWCGDSRFSNQYLDSPAMRNASNSGWMNWTAAKLRTQGYPLITSSNLAVSGTRPDQWSAQITAAIALIPATIGITGPLNAIAQNYPAAGTAVATALAAIKALIKQMNDNGIRVLYLWEDGSSSLTAAQIGMLNDFNRLMADYVQFGDDFRGPPNIVVFDPTPYSTVTSSVTTIQMKNSQDGTHDNVKGAKVYGLHDDTVNLFKTFLRPVPNHRLSQLLQQYPGYGSRNLMQGTTGFTGSTISATGTGNTGVVPANCTTGQSGLVTAAYSVNATSADAYGNTWGSEVQLVATATGAGSVTLYIALNRTSIVAGDAVRGGWEIDVGAATGLAGVPTRLEAFGTNAPAAVYDLINSGIGGDDGGYTGLAIEPPPLVMPGNAAAAPFTNLRLDMVFSGAGSATLKVRKPWAERATA